MMRDDVAGISLNAQLSSPRASPPSGAVPTSNNGPRNDGARPAGCTRDNSLDTRDIFILALPMTFDGVSVTARIMYAMIGENTFRGGKGHPGNEHRIRSGHTDDRRL